MSAPILSLSAGILCPHGGHVSPSTANTRVLVKGVPALVLSDNFPVADCPHEEGRPHGTKPQPCTEISWIAPAARVLISGHPVLVSASTGQCLSVEQIPQGPPVLAGVQARVTAA